VFYIDPLALDFYRKGHDTTDWGIGTAKFYILKHDANRGQPRDEEAAGITARKIIGGLLDAGWTPPTLEN
jgi:hypothetical protein